MIRTKRKKNSCKYWKDKAWKAFSAFIRKRGANLDGYVDCVTCGEPKHWKEMQAGHFIDGRNNTILYDERLVHPQCQRCNVWLGGNKVQYVLFMKRQGYTDEQIEFFDSLRNQIKPMTAVQHKEIFELYRSWLDE